MEFVPSNPGVYHLDVLGRLLFFVAGTPADTIIIT